MCNVEERADSPIDSTESDCNDCFSYVFNIPFIESCALFIEHCTLLNELNVFALMMCMLLVLPGL